MSQKVGGQKVSKIAYLCRDVDVFFLHPPFFGLRCLIPSLLRLVEPKHLEVGRIHAPVITTITTLYINVYKCNNSLEIPSPFCLRRPLDYTNETNSSLLMKHETVLSWHRRQGSKLWEPTSKHLGWKGVLAAIISSLGGWWPMASANFRFQQESSCSCLKSRNSSCFPFQKPIPPPGAELRISRATRSWQNLLSVYVAHV